MTRSLHVARRCALVGALLLGCVGLAPATDTALGAPPPDRVATARAGATSEDACGPRIARPGGRSWTCSFADDFRGIRIDGRKWVVQDSALTGFHTGQTCYTRHASNVLVRRGTLRLTARTVEPFRCGRLPRAFHTRYTGGMIGTKGKFSQAFGRFEVRARFPEGDRSGIHGGLWMYPVDLTYGAWPESGEIDVAEWWSSEPTQVIPSLHYDGRKRSVDSGFDCWVSTPTRFHTYTLVWLRRVMRFSIDGRECFHRRWRPDPPQQAPQPFDQPFSMILNMGVGRTFGRQRVSRYTRFPAQYVVDYVRAWR
ncbi:family 16 glycosylhydrolase [Nocardioides sp. MH1]|uniref:glycoside hydrolase family 16 protein n=1 Tax=Nocardioides sp. MH1 TaxID=3242490 RepID=UPI003522BC2F